MTAEYIYDRVGLTRIGHFVSPIVINASEFKFPKESALLSFLEDRLLPSSTKTIFEKVKQRPMLYTSVEYSKQVFPVKKKTFNIGSFISTFKREEKGFEYILNRTKMVHVESDRLTIYNYNLLDEIYRYKHTKGEDYKRTINKFSTVVACTNNGISMERKRYIHVPITKPIPTLADFVKHSKLDIRRSEDVFNTDFSRFLLEMFKYLSKIGKDSVFNDFSNQEMFDTYFIFTYGSKLSILSLGYLVSSTLWSDINTKVQKKKGITVAKLFLFYILNIIKSEPVEVALLKSMKFTNNLKVVTTDDVGNLKLTDKELDDILTEEIEKSVEEVDENEELVDAVLDRSLSEEEMKVLSKKDETAEEIGERAFEEFISIGVISEKRAEDLKERLRNSEYKVTPATDRELEITEKDKKIKDRSIVDDKTMLSDTLTPFMKKYLNETMERDTVNVMTSMQSAGVIIDNIEVEKKESVLGTYLHYSVSTTLPNGSKKKIRHIIPEVKEDGTFMQSGNTYMMRKQKTDLPIRKISKNESTLASFFGKLFIRRSRLESKDRGYKLYQYLKDLSKTDSDIKMLIFKRNKTYDTVLPNDYTLFGRFIGSVIVKGVSLFFNYDKRLNMGDKKQILKLEKKDKVLFGKKGKVLYFIDMNNILYKYDKDFKKIDQTLYEFCKVDKKVLPLDFVTTKIKGFEIPTALFLVYIFGFKGLLKRLNANFIQVNRTKQFEPTDKEHYDLIFRDMKIRFLVGDPLVDIIFYGLTSIKELKNIDLTSFSTHSGITDFLYLIGMSKYQVVELGLIDKMFIDPITKNVLKLIKEPVIFRELLIRSCELLTTDFVNHPNHIGNMMIKQYDRIPGMIYKTNVDEIRKFYNGIGTYNNTLNVNPFDAMRKINEDSSVMLLEDLNPMAVLKQYEDIILTGEFGRSKETVVGEAREMHKSEVGIISESVKDSGDVGITAYSSASPMIKNTRGLVDIKPIEELNEVNILSTSSMLAPYNNRDDLKRTNFTSIMNGHLVPMLNAVVLPVSTGYDSIIADRIPTKYVIKAEEDGIIKSVNKDEFTILYSNKKKVTHKLYTWNTKEEAGLTYLHKLTCDLSKNTRFEKGDILAFDPLFFGRDIYDQKSVVMKTGIIARVCYQEIDETYEDSTTVSKNFGELFKTPVTKVKSIVVDNTDTIRNMVKVNDKVIYHDALMTIIRNVETIDDTKYELSEESQSILEESRNSSPKAEKDGTIKMIKVFYNCDKKELSPSIKKVVNELEDKYDIEFRVDASYSIKGKPLEEGKVEFKIYIEKPLIMSNGDKGVLGNQLKFTISAIHDNKITSIDKRPIDIKFSTKSKDNRIVNSVDIIAVKTTAIMALQDAMVKLWKS